MSLLSIHMLRILWPKCWLAELPCKMRLEYLPLVNACLVSPWISTSGSLLGVKVLLFPRKRRLAPPPVGLLLLKIGKVTFVPLSLSISNRRQNSPNQPKLLTSDSPPFGMRGCLLTFSAFRAQKMSSLCFQTCLYPHYGG